MLISTITKRLSGVNLLEALGEVGEFITEDTLRQRLSTVVKEIFQAIQERNVQEMSMTDLVFVIRKETDDLQSKNLQEKIIEVLQNRFKSKDKVKHGSRKFKKSIKKERSSSSINPAALCPSMHCHTLDLQDNMWLQDSMKAHSLPKTAHSLKDGSWLESQDSLGKSSFPIDAVQSRAPVFMKISTSAPASTMITSTHAVCSQILSGTVSSTNSSSLVSELSSTGEGEEGEYSYVDLESARTLAWKNRAATKMSEELGSCGIRVDVRLKKTSEGEKSNHVEAKTLRPYEEQDLNSSEIAGYVIMESRLQEERKHHGACGIGEGEGDGYVTMERPTTSEKSSHRKRLDSYDEVFVLEPDFVTNHSLPEKLVEEKEGKCTETQDSMFCKEQDVDNSEFADYVPMKSRFQEKYGDGARGIGELDKSDLRERPRVVKENKERRRVNNYDEVFKLEPDPMTNKSFVVKRSTGLSNK